MSYLTLIYEGQMADEEMAEAVTELVRTHSLCGNKVKILTPVIHNSQEYTFLRTVGLPDEPLVEFVTQTLGLPETAILRISEQGELTDQEYEDKIKAGFPQYLNALITGQAICIQMLEDDFNKWYRPEYDWYLATSE